MPTLGSDLRYVDANIGSRERLEKVGVELNEGSVADCRLVRSGGQVNS